MTTTNLRSTLLSARTRTVVLLLLGGLLLAGGLGDRVLDSVSDPLRAEGDRRLRRALATATVSYLSAAAVNATISVLKSSEMEASFLIVGGSVTVGELLDPVHDLVEQLSSVLTLCIVALGLQNLLLSIGADIGLRYILGPGLLVLAFARVGPTRAATAIRRLGRALVVVALLARFGLPGVLVVSDEVSERILAVRTESAQKRLDQAQSDLSTLVFESSDSLKTRVERARGVAEEALTAIVDLMVAFLFRVVLLPILLFYLVSQLPGLLLRNGQAVVGPHAGSSAQGSA